MQNQSEKEPKFNSREKLRVKDNDLEHDKLEDDNLKVNLSKIWANIDGFPLKGQPPPSQFIRKFDVHSTFFAYKTT